MNKAVLLSVVVYPGSGHLYLRRFRSAIMLIILSTMALTVLIINAVEKAMGIIAKIQQGEIPALDVMAISDMLMKADSAQMQVATTSLVILWVIAIVDTYRLSRK